MTDSVSRNQLRCHADVEARVERRLRTLARHGCQPAPASRVLDLGCGGGDTVSSLLLRDFDAWGCDLRFRRGLNRELLEAEGRLRPIETAPYRLPFDDESFDLVLSDQVFEHIQNIDETFAEIARVTKPGGVGLHVFPARWRPIEVHVLVPFAGVVRARWWLEMWARAGIRNVHQKGASPAEVVERNSRYLRESVNYVAVE